jgi:hypothetical protein
MGKCHVGSVPDGFFIVPDDGALNDSIQSNIKNRQLVIKYFLNPLKVRPVAKVSGKSVDVLLGV